jgi:hypothetical protein
VPVQPERSDPGHAIDHQGLPRPAGGGILAVCEPRLVDLVIPDGGTMRSPTDTPPQDDRHAQLERAFIAEYLQTRHRTLESLRDLPPEEAAALLKEASLYASGRLCEVESRAHLIAELHQGHDPQERERHDVAERDAIAAALDAFPPPSHTEAPERPPSSPRRPLKWML